MEVVARSSRTRSAHRRARRRAEYSGRRSGGQVDRVGAVGVHDEDVGVVATRAGERDLRAVGGEEGLPPPPGRPRSGWSCRAAGVHRPDVAGLANAIVEPSGEKAGLTWLLRSGSAAARGSRPRASRRGCCAGRRARCLHRVDEDDPAAVRGEGGVGGGDAAAAPDPVAGQAVVCPVDGSNREDLRTAPEEPLVDDVAVRARVGEGFGGESERAVRTASAVSFS